MCWGMSECRSAASLRWRGAAWRRRTSGASAVRRQRLALEDGRGRFEGLVEAVAQHDGDVVGIGSGAGVCTTAMSLSLVKMNQ